MIKKKRLLEQSRYSIADLREIMAMLRAPGGCPWDREQTHASIRQNLIEEAYEVCEAIDTNDSAALCEELGDLLLQVVFHSQMADEAGAFDFDDVADGICKKLIHRHPHIFGEVSADTAEQVLTNWDAIKKQEKGQATYTCTLTDVPQALPALMRAAKVQNRAAKSGFDWDTAEAAFYKIGEESDELRAAMATGDEADQSDELGDLLFSAVNVGRLLHLDPELALTRTTDRFCRRFAVVEQLAEERGMVLAEQPLSELDKLWEEAKRLS